MTSSPRPGRKIRSPSRCAPEAAWCSHPRRDRPMMRSNSCAAMSAGPSCVSASRNVTAGVGVAHPSQLTGELVDPCKNIRKGPQCLRRSTASSGNGMASKMTMGSRTRSSHGAPGRSRMWPCSRRPIPVPPPRCRRAEMMALASLIHLSIDRGARRSVANWRGKSSDKNQNEVGG